MSCKSERRNFVTTLLFLTLLSPFDGKLFFLWIFLIVTTTNSIISVSSFRIFGLPLPNVARQYYLKDSLLILSSSSIFRTLTLFVVIWREKKIRHFLEIDMARLLHLSALIWWKKLRGNFLSEKFTIDFFIIIHLRFIFINFSDYDFVCRHLTRKKIRHFLEIDKARLR